MVCKDVLYTHTIKRSSCLISKNSISKVEWFQILLCFTNHLIKHESFVSPQLNVQIVLFQANQFSISHLFELFKCQTVYLTLKLNPVWCYYSGPERTWERWQWRCNPHSQNLRHYWCLSIRLFSFISKTFVVMGSYSSAELQSVYAPAIVD